MKRLLYFLVVIFVLLVITESIAAADPAKVYIENYKRIAIQEMHRVGVPASIKLAQGLLESDWGKSKLATEANNHFGIKCGTKWEGRSFYKTDDDFDAMGNLTESCFRSYNKAEESYINHSDFLKDPNKSNRYGFLFDYKTNDYVSWAYGLQTAGYASDPKYPQKIIQIIEKYQLNEFDEKVDVSEKVVNRTPKLEAKNTTKTIGILPTKAVINTKFITLGSDLLAEVIARQYDIEMRKFLSYNEVVVSPNEVIKAGTIVYLEQKSRDFKGDQTHHQVGTGETFEKISHKYGIRSRTLRALNKEFASDEQPNVGFSMRLRK
jgi:GR25 family glycosyltransferase involved in LPS biosynthesis